MSTRIKILDFMFNNKESWLPSKEVAKAVGIAHKTARHNLLTLERAGVLESKAEIRDKSGAPKRKLYKFKEGLSYEEALRILKEKGLLGEDKPKKSASESKKSKKEKQSQGEASRQDGQERPTRFVIRRAGETIARLTDAQLHDVRIQPVSESRPHIEEKHAEKGHGEKKHEEAESAPSGEREPVQSGRVAQPEIVHEEVRKVIESIDAGLAQDDFGPGGDEFTFESGQEAEAVGVEDRKDKETFVIKVNGIQILEVPASSREDVLRYAMDHFGKKITYELSEEEGKQVLDIKMKFGTKG